MLLSCHNNRIEKLLFHIAEMKHTTIIVSLLLIVLLTSTVLFAGTANSSHPKNKSAPVFSNDQKKILNQGLRGNGMRFTQNKGQIADINGKLYPDILYKGESAGTDIYLRKTGISYVYSNLAELIHEVNEQAEKMEEEGTISGVSEQETKDRLMQNKILKTHRVDMSFINCNSNVTPDICEEDEIEGLTNYYYEHCPQGITNVKQFNKIRYKNIYNDIDVCYYGNQEAGIKYDIIVKPNADPNQIKLEWVGAKKIYINNQGNLVIKTSLNEFYESMPKVYQNINGRIVDVKAKYKLTLSPSGRAGEGLVTFELGNWNPKYPLIIDPATWITYFGGSNVDTGNSVTVDNLGNPIFSGYTASVNFPFSVGAYQTALVGGPFDSYVVKMSPAGSRIFATYFGGSASDLAYGIDADNNNDIYLTGYTNGSGLPTLAWGAAYMAPYAGGNDGFIAKFSAAGALIWSTYYGGTSLDYAYDVITDGANNIIFTGHTYSSDLPITAGAFQIAQSGGSSDVFVVKFNNLGVRQWATYYGGAGNDNVTAITVDFSNNIYVCGTARAGFPMLLPFQGAFGGVTDGFLFRLNTVNGFPVWSTYYGGTALDWSVDVAADALGNVFLGVYTSSINTGNKIATAGAYQIVLKGPSDAALIKFTNAGARVWGTYLGGSVGPGTSGGYEEAGGVAVDVNNNIVIAGDTYSTDFPVTSCAYQTAYSGREDQFITTFNQQGNLICSTYLGGNASQDDEYCGAAGLIAVSGGFVYMAVQSPCSYPVTAGAFQTVCGGNGDAAFSRLCIYTCGIPNTVSNFTTATTSVCPNTPVSFTLTNTSCDSTATTYLWSFTGATPATSTSINPGAITWSAAGNYEVSVKVMSPCDTITITKTNYITINSCGVLSATAIKTDISCNGTNTGSATATAVTGTANYTYSWSNGATNITNATTNTITGLSANTYTVTITDGTASTATAEVAITQPTTLTSSIAALSISCSGGTTSATAVPGGGTPGYIYNWSASGQTTVTATGLTQGNYTVTVTDANNCTNTSAVIINSPSPLIGLFAKGTSSCTGCGCKEWIMVNATGGTSPYSYLWPDGYINRYKNQLCPGIYNITVKDKNGCSISVNLTAP